MQYITVRTVRTVHTVRTVQYVHIPGTVCLGTLLRVFSGFPLPFLGAENRKIEMVK
jgi:hypothetical protein